MEVGAIPRAIAYHEPSIDEILIYSGFLLLLNLLGWVLDAFLFCGLVGQILVGVAWGALGLQLLSIEAQDVVAQLGYLGLILIVYEGGLTTSFQSLRANAGLSILVAATGIVAPIALSFWLHLVARASYLQCFAAGAALCSTSLGTTFAILRSSGLSSSKLGTVLSSAAMMDDIVGLVMVQVISNIGPSGTTIPAPMVVRPVMVSLAFGVVTPVACVFLIRPTTTYINSIRKKDPGGRVDKLLRHRQTSFGFQVVLLLSLVAASSYAGTSNLFAAYIAGAVVSWWDSEVPHLKTVIPNHESTRARGIDDQSPVEAHEDVIAEPAVVMPDRHEPSAKMTCCGVYEFYISQTVRQVFQPFFFASIGFAIPITEMFSGEVLWRGLVFSFLMFAGKLLCGIWFLPLPRLYRQLRSSLGRVLALVRVRLGLGGRRPESHEAGSATAEPSRAQRDTWSESLPSTDRYLPQETPLRLSHIRGSGSYRAASPRETPMPAVPATLYPAAIVGTAMVARGEIGFLISSIAQSQDIFRVDSSETSQLFLIVTWAIMLCTIAGPLCLGVLIWRTRRLARRKGYLGNWHRELIMERPVEPE